MNTLDQRLADEARRQVDARIQTLAGRIDPRSLRSGQPGRETDRRIVKWLKKALRAERAKALRGHWSYDAGRHLRLRAALMSALEARPGHVTRDTTKNAAS
ncbi:hypothetical protein ACKTEK_03120 [Tepidamorphus sp. 3E244]|uniref:hypothetical protein n=1 Tax=Tepidamorphus sp. 3E244 TaxID=3385498 RepID=UPI0038FC5A7B